MDWQHTALVPGERRRSLFEMRGLLLSTRPTMFVTGLHARMGLAVRAG